MSVSILFPRFDHPAIEEVVEQLRTPITGERLERYFAEPTGSRT